MNINPFIDLLATVLDLYAFALVVSVIMGWLIMFNVVNRYNPFVSKLAEVLHKITEPVMRKIRPFMPSLGGIDISPLVILIAIIFFKNVLYTYFYTFR